MPEILKEPAGSRVINKWREQNGQKPISLVSPYDESYVPGVGERLLNQPASERLKQPEIPTYTYEELQNLNLPGYKYSGDEYDVLDFIKSDWTPVLSLSIFLVDPETGVKRVLTGVRKSNTHNDVISTPTMQMIKSQGWLNAIVRSRESSKINQPPEILLENAPRTRQFAEVTRYEATQDRDWVSMNGMDMLGKYVNDLCTYKLDLPGIETSIGRKTVGLGAVSLASVNIGFSCVGENQHGQPLYEAITKVVATMNLPVEAVGLIARENRNYKYLGWTEDSRTFARDVEKKDTFRLAPIAGSVALYLCALGLCLDATSSVTTRDDLDELLEAGEWLAEMIIRSPDVPYIIKDDGTYNIYFVPRTYPAVPPGPQKNTI